MWPSLWQRPGGRAPPGRAQLRGEAVPASSVADSPEGTEHGSGRGKKLPVDLLVYTVCPCSQGGEVLDTPPLDPHVRGFPPEADIVMSLPPRSCCSLGATGPRTQEEGGSDEACGEGEDSEPAQVGSTVASVGRVQLDQGHWQDQQDPADRHMACGCQGLEDSGGDGRVLLGSPLRCGDHGSLARLTATASTQGSRGLPAGFARVSPAVLDGRRVRPSFCVPRNLWQHIPHTTICDACHAWWGCTLHNALPPE